ESASHRTPSLHDALPIFRRRDGRLARLLDLRAPVVGQAVGAIDGVGLPRPRKLGEDVFPDDVAFGRDLEDSAAGPLGDERIAVRDRTSTRLNSSHVKISY